MNLPPQTIAYLQNCVEYIKLRDEFLKHVDPRDPLHNSSKTALANKATEGNELFKKLSEQDVDLLREVLRENAGKAKLNLTTA